MATKHVQSDALNLRSAPTIADNIVATLDKGQLVNTVAPVDAATSATRWASRPTPSTPKDS